MSPNNAEMSDREMLIRVRGEILEKVGSYSSEELAAAGDFTRDAGQLTVAQCNAGTLFGVRFGRSWHYPQFQFDPDLRPYPEMKAIIQALPDELGWDRVQWFLEPHERLQGRTPLEVWKTDRNKIVAAANTERWGDRL